MINDIIAHIDAGHDDYLERLNAFLRIPSISTDPEAKPAVRQAATWVQAFFEKCGIESMIVETEGHPAVIADTGPADAGAPTVLVYGHYDVQPTGDDSLWHSRPFEPEIRDGRIYARGSADDKGQVFCHMLAAEAWKKVAGKLPIRVKFLLEGEEEIGSKHLGTILEEQKERLACDYVCLSDTPKLSEETPAITYGTKGMVYKEINYFAQTQDLHSGAFGGTFRNPGNALTELIAKMKDADNRVTIEGFYDDVLESTPEELASLKSLPFDDEEYRNSVGAKALVGEKGFTTLQRRWLRPTLDVNGLLCGFTGEGSMTIIPAKAMAKVSMRLVPNQSAEKVSQAFDTFVKKHTPAGIDHKIKTFTNCEAYMCPLDNPGLKQAAAAVEAGFGVAPAFTREGGSLPILPLFKQVLGAESLMIGFSLPTCNLHGPNEFLVVDDFFKGIRTSAQLFEKMSC